MSEEEVVLDEHSCLSEEQQEDLRWHRFDLDEQEKVVLDVLVSVCGSGGGGIMPLPFPRHDRRGVDGDTGVSTLGGGECVGGGGVK